MTTLREYNITIKLKVGTYQSDAEVMEFAKNLRAGIDAAFDNYAGYNFVAADNPTVEVEHGTRT